MTQTLPNVLAEIAFDMACQRRQFAEWSNAFSINKPGSNEMIESFFDALDQYKIDSKDRVTTAVLFDEMVKKHAHQRIQVILGHETDKELRQDFIQSIELKLGPLDWSFEVNKHLGDLERLKLGEKVKEVGSVGQLARTMKH